MKLAYIGPLKAVQVFLPQGREIEVKQGESEDFPGPLAASLLEQETNWKDARQAGLDAGLGDLVTTGPELAHPAAIEPTPPADSPADSTAEESTKPKSTKKKGGVRNGS